MDDLPQTMAHIKDLATVVKAAGEDTNSITTQNFCLVFWLMMFIHPIWSTFFVPSILSNLNLMASAPIHVTQISERPDSDAQDSFVNDLH